MASPQVQLLAENLPEHRFLEAIFLEERRAGLVTVSSYLLPSTALAAAELYLLQDRQRPIALVLNSGTKVPEQIERKRASLQRVLSRITPEHWLVVLAIPDVDSWIMADPQVQERMAADLAFRESRDERSARIAELARTHPLDRNAIGQAHPEFRDLVGFIEQHTSVHTQTLSQNCEP
ncbi:MAG: hypothetical protein P4L84_35135 [Isosphaeraceae bacterium]|nr:hypothetical protein [Isosphaeraceae bacterium]